jgi:hypothetical protein
VPLRRQDIQLWRANQILPHNCPIEVLRTADSVTINLENQKNGKKGYVVHHQASGCPILDPVSAMVRLVHEIQSMPISTPLGTYRNEQLQVCRVKSTDIISAVRYAAVGDNLPAAGFVISRMGSHSVRSGGALNLKLNGYDHDIIKKLGRWSSDTYLLYIQSSIGELTQGISHRMATTLRFHRVGL